MNTTEHLVEAFYQQQGCLTTTDVKIVKGNNRQIDLLAVNLKTEKYYHVEISVAHTEQWPVTLDKIKQRIRYKFFGTTINSRPENPKTDFAKGKTYLNQIKETYSKFGFDFSKVIRVWCAWSILDASMSDILKWKNSLAAEFKLEETNFEILLFRDDVLPKLLECVGTAYYDDQLLRTLSLVKEYNRQTNQV